MDKFLNQTSLLVISSGLFLVLLTLREGSAWLTRRLAPVSDTDHPGYVLTGVLGLLSLLIAFTFGLALDRYEARYNLLVAEAAALNTVDMRVRLLDQPASGRLVQLVHRYAKARLDYGEADAAQKPPYERPRRRFAARSSAKPWPPSATSVIGGGLLWSSNPSTTRSPSGFRERPPKTRRCPRQSWWCWSSTLSWSLSCWATPCRPSGVSTGSCRGCSSCF